MVEHTEDTQTNVVRLSKLEARYTRIRAVFMEHPTPDNQQALQNIGDEYEKAVQGCWDKGMIPVVAYVRGDLHT